MQPAALSWMTPGILTTIHPASKGSSAAEQLSPKMSDSAADFAKTAVEEGWGSPTAGRPLMS